MYDAMGPEFTLLRFDPQTDANALIDAAKTRGVPLQVLDVQAKDVPDLYHNALVLSRPDQHVAWRGNRAPDDPLKLMDLVRGYGSV